MPLRAVLVTALLCCAPAAAQTPVLVTIDDLPIASRRLHATDEARASLTRELLEVLARHRVTAVGFVRTAGVEGPADAALLASWLAAGHELGNHGHRHLDYGRTSIEAYVADSERARAWLDAFLRERGRALRFFRFPFLREGETPEKLEAMRAWLARTGQRNLPVTIDTQDWMYEEPWVLATRAGDAAAARRVGEEYLASLMVAVGHHERHATQVVGPGTPQVLLLHANAVGAGNWDRLFRWLTETGHRFATPDEVLGHPAFSRPHRFVAATGPSLWDRLDHERRLDEARRSIETLLAEQAGAWSRGDLEAFVSVYADDATFLAPSGMVRGRQAVLERYRAKYPDGAAMGALTLEVLELRPAWGMEASVLGDAEPGDVHGASVVARWTLRFPEREPASGLTLIVFHRAAGGRWLIVQDASM